MLGWLRPQARGRDSGAVAVEAALITPLLLLIVFGIIEFTLALRSYVAVASAVRAGARTASAEPRLPQFAADTAAQMTTAVGALSDSGIQAMWIFKGATRPASCTSNCIAYTWNGTAFTNPQGSWSYTSINACPISSTNPSGPDKVGVYLQYRHSFVTGLFGLGVPMADQAVLNFEPVPPSAPGGCKP